MQAKLVIVHGQPAGKALVFPHGEFIIGRGDECHVRPNSTWVSRQHCLLRIAGDRMDLTDLGSRNGTLVNGQRLVGERRLAHGDQVQIGPLVFRVSLEDSGIGKGLALPAAPETGDTGEVQALQGTDPVIPVLPTPSQPKQNSPPTS